MRPSIVTSILVYLCLPACGLAQDVRKDVLGHIRNVSVSIEWNGRTHGSGTLFEKDGETWCLTANHVVTAAAGSQLRVAQHSACGLAHAKVVAVNAELVTQDEQHDYALLKLGKGVFKHHAKFHGPKCPPIELDLPVIHCGSPRGLHHTVTRGYLVGLNRRVTISDLHGQRVYDQVDLTVDAGSSGGGVFNTQGHLIGIVVASAGQRLALIVPIRQIKAIQ